jgi:hypothetical protein
MNVTLVVKLWGWPNPSQESQRMNASENLHMQLHMTSSYAMNLSIKTYNLN